MSGVTTRYSLRSAFTTSAKARESPQPCRPSQACASFTVAAAGGENGECKFGLFIGIWIVGFGKVVVSADIVSGACGILYAIGGCFLYDSRFQG